MNKQKKFKSYSDIQGKTVRGDKRHTFGLPHPTNRSA
jgi:hypothetical protein